LNPFATSHRFHTVRLGMTRLLAVLALAIALVAIPAFSPDDASAKRMSERSAGRACSNAGGSMYYDFDGPRSDTMSCSLPSGASFSCDMVVGPFGDQGNCSYTLSRK